MTKRKNYNNKTVSIRWAKKWVKSWTTTIGGSFYDNFIANVETLDNHVKVCWLKRWVKPYASLMGKSISDDLENKLEEYFSKHESLTKDDEN